jgi:hypothetical protein
MQSFSVKAWPARMAARSAITSLIQIREGLFLRARAKITSHFKRRCILPGGVAKARNMLDMPALSRLARSILKICELIFARTLSDEKEGEDGYYFS